MKNIKLTCVLVLMTSSAFASHLNRPQEAVAVKRNDFIDYSINNEEGDTSYTLGVEIRALKPRLSCSIGTESFDIGEGENKFIEGRSIHFDHTVIPSISAHMLISNKNSGTLLYVSLDHYNKFGVDEPISSQENSNIFLNESFYGKNDHVGYSKIQNTFNNEMTGLKLALGGYSLQYKNFSLTSLLGVVGNQMSLEIASTGTVASSNDLLVNTFIGKQTSIAAGTFCGLKPSLVIYDSEFSAIYISAELNFTGECSFNTGNVYQYQVNTESEVKSNTSNTSIDECSYTGSSDKKLSISLVSKPQDNDMSFFTMQIGVGHEVHAGKDMITKVRSGSAGDISSAYAFLSLSYTM